MKFINQVGLTSFLKKMSGYIAGKENEAGTVRLECVPLKKRL